MPIAGDLVSPFAEPAAAPAALDEALPAAMSEALPAAADEAPAAPPGPEGVELGTLVLRTPERTMSYRFTPDDLMWTAKLLVNEAGGRDDAENAAVLHAMLNRYALFTHQVYRTFAAFVRRYSTTLQPVLLNAQAAARHMHKPPSEFVRTGGTYPGTTIPRGQLRRHLDLQRSPWRSVPAAARDLATRALTGRLANPGVGLASEFASTRIYFRQQFHREPGVPEWRRYTEEMAARKRWRWVGDVPGLDQMRNAFFVDLRAAGLPADAVRVVPPGAAEEAIDEVYDEEDYTGQWEEDEEDFAADDRPEPAGHEAPADATEAELAPMMAEAEGLFDQLRAAYRRAVDTANTRARIATGTTDENKLTNLVFFDRHPGRPRGPLTASDPDFGTLRAEWMDIRDRIVRPALRAAAGASYDRAGAMAYARKFWLRACDDNFIATSGSVAFQAVPAGTVFAHDFAPDGITPLSSEHAVLPDGTEIPWARLDDCTHFISCCIGQRPGETSGGLKLTFRQLGSPPAAPYGMVRVSTMVDFLTGRLPGHPARYAEMAAEKTTDAAAVGLLQPGDLVAYFNRARGRYSHLALLLEGNKIACHSYARSDQPACTWDNDWKLGEGTHSWTFLRFVV